VFKRRSISYKLGHCGGIRAKDGPLCHRDTDAFTSQALLTGPFILWATRVRAMEGQDGLSENHLSKCGTRHLSYAVGDIRGELTFIRDVSNK
jgi:hypothetical protein